MADKTEETADAARRQAADVGEELREKGAEAARAARDQAWHYAERARDEAYARGEQYREYAADETGKVASALRRASEDLSSGSPQERLVGQIADGVADVAERMRGMTAADIARDTNDFARRHPAAFLSGAALVGFAAARFLKASAHHDEQSYPPPARTAEPPAPAPAAPRPATSAPPPSGATAGTSGVAGPTQS